MNCIMLAADRVPVTCSSNCWCAARASFSIDGSSPAGKVSGNSRKAASRPATPAVSRGCSRGVKVFSSGTPSNIHLIPLTVMLGAGFLATGLPSTRIRPAGVLADICITRTRIGVGICAMSLAARSGVATLLISCTVVMPKAAASSSCFLSCAVACVSETSSAIDRSSCSRAYSRSTPVSLPSGPRSYLPPSGSCWDSVMPKRVMKAVLRIAAWPVKVISITGFEGAIRSSASRVTWGRETPSRRSRQRARHPAAIWPRRQRARNGFPPRMDFHSSMRR